MALSVFRLADSFARTAVSAQLLFAQQLIFLFTFIYLRADHYV